MAAGLPQCRCGLFQHLLFSLWVLQGGLVTSISGVEVTQHPPLANKRQGETLELSCDVHQNTYHYYWYRQLPGEINLEHLGTIYSTADKLEEIPKNDLNSRLSGKRFGTKVYLYLKGLQLTDSGQYLCASRDTVIVAAPGAVIKPNNNTSLDVLLRNTSSLAAPKDASPSESKEGRRARKEPSRRAGSSREDFARGAREAAVLCEQAYFADTGTQLIVEDENCQRSQPTVHLLGPVCHKDHVTLVCVAQGFPYEWPIDVSWKRDGQEVTRLSFATDPVRTLNNGTCNFGVSSRLRMTAAEWQERHVYSCHVRQGNIAEAEESMEREPSQQPASTVSEFQSSLHTGQLIFLLLVVKSFAYGTALGIYTACKKKTGL
ncbi:uncharacterized protein LOC128417775 [Podarcis raffonei]|uniref:uncharacterized protein LOC128417775 n=1 Tax=Podarcis raffonei TaxID=65483 RepID=UPI002329933C|nr:uncharacterized protein LOC128417775 [Podarcis raffonei]